MLDRAARLLANQPDQHGLGAAQPQVRDDVDHSHALRSASMGHRRRTVLGPRLPASGRCAGDGMMQEQGEAIIGRQPRQAQGVVAGKGAHLRAFAQHQPLALFARRSQPRSRRGSSARAPSASGRSRSARTGSAVCSSSSSSSRSSRRKADDLVLAGIDGAAEQPPMARIPDAGNVVAQLHEIAVPVDHDDGRHGVADAQRHARGEKAAVDPRHALPHCRRLPALGETLTKARPPQPHDVSTKRESITAPGSAIAKPAKVLLGQDCWRRRRCIRTGDSRDSSGMRTDRGAHMRDWSKADWVDPSTDWKPLPVSDMPERLLIDFATRCNLRCHMCPVWGLEDEKQIDDVKGIMNLDAARKMLDEFAKAQPMVAPSIYGEPLLIPNLREVLADMKRRGIAVAMNTNGLTLTPELAEFFCQIEVNSVMFSLNSTTPETLKKVRGVDKLAKIEAAVFRMLKARGEPRAAARRRILHEAGHQPPRGAGVRRPLGRRGRRRAHGHRVRERHLPRDGGAAQARALRRHLQDHAGAQRRQRAAVLPRWRARHRHGQRLRAGREGGVARRGVRQGALLPRDRAVGQSSLLQGLQRLGPVRIHRGDQGRAADPPLARVRLLQPRSIAFPAGPAISWAGTSRRRKSCSARASGSSRTSPSSSAGGRDGLPLGSPSLRACTGSGGRASEHPWTSRPAASAASPSRSGARVPAGSSGVWPQRCRSRPRHRGGWLTGWRATPRR